MFFVLLSGVWMCKVSAVPTQERATYSIPWEKTGVVRSRPIVLNVMCFVNRHCITEAYWTPQAFELEWYVGCRWAGAYPGGGARRGPWPPPPPKLTPAGLNESCKD